MCSVPTTLILPAGYAEPAVITANTCDRCLFRCIDDFSHDHMTPDTEAFLQVVVERLESIRQRYLETKDKKDWYDIIQLLPSSYNQMRTCSFNYETLINIYYARKDHKLAEWHTFCDWILTLPYAQELIVCADN